jgi:hypothetical protein
MSMLESVARDLVGHIDTFASIKIVATAAFELLQPGLPRSPINSTVEGAMHKQAPGVSAPNCASNVRQARFVTYDNIGLLTVANVFTVFVVNC